MNGPRHGRGCGGWRQRRQLRLRRAPFGHRGRGGTKGGTSSHVGQRLGYFHWLVSAAHGAFGARRLVGAGPAESSEQRRRRLLLREVTRGEARPKLPTALSAAGQPCPFLRGPPPAPAEFRSPPGILESSSKCCSYSRKAPLRADRTPERHWDSWFAICSWDLLSRREHALPPVPRVPENPSSGSPRPAWRRGEDWRLPADPSPPARAGDGAAARRRPELPARGLWRRLRVGPGGGCGIHEPGDPQHDGHPLRVVGVPRRDGGGAAQAAVPAPQSAQGAPGAAPQRHSQASRPEQSVMQALESLTETQPPAAPGPGRAGGGGFRKYRFILFKHPWHRQGPQSPERGGERPQVSDFLSGRSPLTLALRVGDHMMFVQLQLAAQHAPLQHRHVLAAAAAAAAATRRDPSVTTPVSSPCRPVSSAARIPPVPTSPVPESPSPVTAGSFHSHAASTTCPEMDCSPAASTQASPTSTPGASPTSRSRKPGAIIESFVNHAPGVFSGTFSGTLHPNCQDSSGRPRRDIGTILQILNDLLSATRHYQGMPPSLTQLRCHAQCAPASPTADLAPKTTSCEKLAATTTASLSQARLGKPTGDRLRQTENRATRCKVERLQLLLQQKRLRRKARRDARGPYHWPPSRKTGRSDSSSGDSGGSPSEAAGLGLDFEESVWKPEVNPDIKSEFVVA
ncbi:midnolin isoform X2 [Saccopteryx bilineata]|uniref:midnolin isoform X2 n=1 Tax=Saccopteryx bilineata TaxID=59482 RepID=UPI00338E03C4